MFDRRHFALACLVLPFFSLVRTKAQSPDVRQDAFTEHHQELLTRNPEALMFTARLKDGKTQFHPGEIIRLELSFLSSQPDTYVMNNASYDRSGRLGIDDFVLDRREGVVDPLHDYYHSGLHAFMGGGLFSVSTLDKKPQLVNYELNEWFRFDKPGKYRLYVISGRIAQGQPYHQGNKPVALTSDMVEFEIVPADPKWEQQALSEALKTVNSTTTGNSLAKENEHRAACRVLRFLGTEAAIKESIRRFRGQDRNCDFEYDFGLLGTPRRAFTVSQMESALDAPEQPVTNGFVATLSFLSYLVENPRPLSKYPANNEAERKVWELQLAERRGAYEGVVQKYVGRLAIAVKQKQGAASAVSLETLIDFQTRGNSPSDEARRRELAASLTKVFLDLPLDMQQSLLEYRWKQIADPAMLPILRQLYEHPPDMHVIPAPFPGLALQRIYELAPDEGRQLILDEIRKPKLRVRIAVLGSLPDKELPQLEDAIVERAINSMSDYREQETAVALVNRYASGASLPRLRVAFENKIGELDCTVQSSLISYFLGHDEAFGLEMLRKALAARKKTRCFADALTSAAQKKNSPEFEELALEYLDDKDEDVMRQAVQVLASYGAASDKARVKTRIKRQLDQWREEKRDPDASISSTNSVYLGYFAEGLLQAYANALAWFVDEEELKELAELCLNEQCRGQAKAWASRPREKIWFYNSLSDNIQFSVAHYTQLSRTELERKLAQFPKGTVFTWNPQLENREKEADLFVELKGYLEGLGMKLVRQQRPEK